MNKPQRREGFVADDKAAAAAPEAPVETEASPPPEPSLPQEDWPIVVKLLHKPIRNQKNEMVRELSFREPTGGDINRYGNPCRVDQNGDVVIDERKMSMMMSSLSGCLLPMFEQIDPRDWNSCAYRLRGFFLPDPAAW